MGVYLAIVVLELLFFAKYKVGGRDKPHLFSFLGALLLILVMALRFDIGADYNQYYIHFQKAIQRSEGAEYEPLNDLLLNLLRFFGSPHTVIAVYGILTISIVFYTLKKYSDNIYIAILSYTALFFLPACSTIRQALAAAIILFAYPYLRDRRYRFYFSVCIVAILFHYSAVIAIFFPLLYNCRAKLMFLGVGVTALVFVIGMDMVTRIPFLSKYSVYLDLFNGFGGGNIQKILFWGIIAGLWLSGGIKNVDNRKLLVLCTFGCIFPMLMGGHLGGRFAQYMYIFLCIAIPNILKNAPSVFRLTYIIILNVWFLSYAYTAIDDEDTKSYIPYQTIFEVNTDSPVFK